MTPKLMLPTVLVALAVTLWLTSVPGVFIIDEDNYIATVVGLRDGSLKLPSTTGLPPSRELLSFDAAPMSRAVPSTPVTSVAPPLYAVFALPFSPFGVRGLIALQVLAFCVCAWLVHSITRRTTARVDLAWLALGTFVFASFSIEYAQATWPHMLSAALVLGAFDLTLRLADQPRWRGAMFAVAAGLCAGAAAGMRYQNIALAGLLGLTLLLWRRRAVAPYLLGLALPLFVSGAMNARRIGSWNPISKGPGYAEIALVHDAPARVPAAFVSTWARLVDYTAWPQPPVDAHGTHTILRKHPDTGAFQLQGALKKALLQSAPWVLISLLAVGLAWRRHGGATTPSSQLLRRISLLAAGMIGMFALYGFRHDGWCFNQRYLLELMPLFSIALALALENVGLRWKTLAAGALGGTLLGLLLTRLAPNDTARQLIIMKAPLVIAAAVAGAWLVARRPTVAREHALAALVGVSLGWAASIHLGEDVSESRRLRESNRARLAEFERAVPANMKAAIIAYWGNKDAFGPLTLDRDLVIVDPWIDEGASLRLMVDALVAQGRTIYIAGALPRHIITSLSGDYGPRRVEGARNVFQLVPTKAPGQ